LPEPHQPLVLERHGGTVLAKAAVADRHETSASGTVPSVVVQSAEPRVRADSPPPTWTRPNSCCAGGESRVCLQPDALARLIDGVAGRAHGPVKALQHVHYRVVTRACCTASAMLKPSARGRDDHRREATSPSASRVVEGAQAVGEAEQITKVVQLRARRHTSTARRRRPGGRARGTERAPRTS
jgi:hypothetical protein